MAIITIQSAPKSEATHRVQRLKGSGFYYFGNLEDAQDYANQLITKKNLFFNIETIGAKS